MIGAMFYLFAVKPHPVTYLNVDGPLVHDAFIKICLMYDKRIILGARQTWNFLNKIDDWHVEIINTDNPGYIKKLLSKAGYRD